MFRYLFVLFILSISLYGLYGVFSGAEKKLTLRENFQTFLSGAIERNSGQTHDVRFVWSDFIDTETNDSVSQGVNIQENNQEMYTLNNNINNSLGLGNKLTDATVTIQQEEINGEGSGSFGTPATRDFNRDAPVNCDGGLIYDPCLVVGDPIPASGGMYFGSDRG